MASKKVTLSADGATATVAAATFGDIFTTMFSTTENVTGGYKLVQDFAWAAIGATVQKYQDTGALGIPFMK